MKNTIITCLCCLLNIAVLAQCTEWNWPTDRKLAEEKIALLQDAIREKKYRQAVKPLNWLLTNAPTLNSNVYIQGATVYDELAFREKNAVAKKRYVDSLLLIYDLRIQYCGDQSNVLPRKTSAAFRLLINSPEANRVLPLFDTLMAKYPKEISDGMLLPYMQTVVVNKQKFNMLSDNQIVSRYDKLTKLTNARIKAVSTDTKRKASLTKIKKDIDTWLFKVIKPDCDFVRAKLAPEFNNNPADSIIAKRIFTYMLQGKCTEDPLWLKAALVVYENEKDFVLAKNIALRYFAMDSLAVSSKYFDSALNDAKNQTDSAEVYFYKGAAEAKRNQKEKSREYFLKAAQLDKTKKEAYEKIGDLYMDSFKECANLERQADDRAIYIAAYQYYVRSGNARKMAIAKQSFPSREEIFVFNYHIGDKMKINCWINEEVTLMTRD